MADATGLRKPRPAPQKPADARSASGQGDSAPDTGSPLSALLSGRVRTLIDAVDELSDGHEMTEQEAAEVLRRLDAVSGEEA